MVTSLQYNRTHISISGTGFQSSIEMNTVYVGEQGVCNVTIAQTNLIVCTIINTPCGQHLVRLNVQDKGLARSNGSLLIDVKLFITSFTPHTGSIGGGYNLNVFGHGFSSNTRINIGNTPCLNMEYISTTNITCAVPPSGSNNVTQVIVSAFDGTYSANASNLFTYNATNTPLINSIHPPIISVLGGTVMINGSGFGNGSITVYVNDTSVPVLSSSMSHIQINLTSMPSGRYPLTVSTSFGFARPLQYVEYRFFLESISPQIGSLLGGTNVYVSGQGFNNETVINFRDESGQRYPCISISTTSTLIQCQTTPSIKQVTLVPTGTHVTYGFGFVWSSPHLIISRGTNVTWRWSALSRPNPLSYRIQQVASPFQTQPMTDGFDSGPATLTGMVVLY